MPQYILALDQGTTSSRCIIFDHNGAIKSLAQKEFTQLYPQPGWVEHNPMEIWSSQLAVAAEAMAQAGLTTSDIKAIGITNQRETTIVWNKDTGEPIHNAIVWQCRRTAEKVEELKSLNLTDYIREHTGLIPDAYFSATKIAWLLDNIDGARARAEAGELLFGTVDTWLVWKLTAGKKHVTDLTNASRTMIFDIHRLCWDEKLLTTLNIPANILPEVYPSGYHFGDTDPAVLGGEIPIAGIAGDQQAALFGQCCFEKGEVKNTYGTGCFLLMNTGNEAITSRHGLITTIAASVAGKKPSPGNDNSKRITSQFSLNSSHICDFSPAYALEGSVFVAGAAVQWLRDGMRMIKSASESQEYAEKVADTEGCYLVPAFTGLGAPYWNPYTRGVLVGITRGFTKEHFIRAALEAIAYQTVDVLKAMEEDAGVLITGLKVDGGASANDFLMQFQADILNAEAHRPECIETTALGAAYLAGLTVGFWADMNDIRQNWHLNRTFAPSIEAKQRENLLSGWRKAVKCALAWE
ncbi:MAG: glycerol kinase GlpK [Lachnospiraceae bacterium]|nr:glycerol kinase GlpK [Lachnospiraceae bacterium]